MEVIKQAKKPKKPMSYKYSTGLPLTKFLELQNRIQEILDQRPTPSKGPGGRPVILGLHQQLRIVLHLLRHNVRQAFIADLYGISQSTVSRLYRKLMPLISMALALEAPNLKDALARGESLIVDGTDVRVRKHLPAIKTHYSGKKKRHCVNIQVVTTLAGRAIYIGEPVPGRTHDRVAFTQTGIEQLLADSPYLADLGYQGTSGMLPYKKGHRPGVGELIGHDQKFNKALSKYRAAVERGNAHLKNWKILSEIYRGVFHELPVVIRIVSLLEFFRDNASGTQY